MTYESELLLQLQLTLYTSRNATRRWLHCSRRDWIIDKLRACAGSKPGKALDAGFGSGVYLPVLAELAQEAFATDLQATFVEHATLLTGKYPNLHPMVDDITQSQLNDDEFDLVLCTEVIEHIADSQRALREIYRLLKPHGVLVLSTPQPLSPLELMGKIAFMPGVINLVRKVYKEPILETGHINLMSERRLVGQMKAAGFVIRERFKSGLYLPLIAEFLPESGLRLEQWLERVIRRGPLGFLLWTQYYVAEKPAPRASTALGLRATSKSETPAGSEVRARM